MYEVKIVENENELNLAYSIRKKVFVDEQGVPPHLELDDQDQYAIHFIVKTKQENQVIGAARLRIIEEKNGKVERVCILKEHRGKNLGLLIMNKIEDYANSKGIAKLKLNAQCYAIPFYEKLNYAVTTPEFLDAGIPHRAMEKSLVQSS